MVMTVRLPFSGTPTTLKMTRSINSDIRNIMAVIGRILPA